MGASFKWGEGEIHIVNSSVKTRLRQNRLNRLVNLDTVEDDELSELLLVCNFYLSHVERVKGDVGLHIPYQNATEEQLQTFFDDFLSADESLMNQWDNAILQARVVTNDADLLPPKEVDPNA